MKTVSTEILMYAVNSEASLFSAKQNKDKTGYDVTTIYGGKEVVVCSLNEKNGQLSNVIFDPKRQYTKELIAVDIASLPDGKPRDVMIACFGDDLSLDKELANKLRCSNPTHYDLRKKEIQNYNIAKTKLASRVMNTTHR